MHTYVYTCIHLHIHKHMYIYTHTHTYTYACTCIRTHVKMCVRVYVNNKCTYACMYISIYAWMHIGVYMCMYACMHACTVIALGLGTSTATPRHGYCTFVWLNESKALCLELGDIHHHSGRHGLLVRRCQIHTHPRQTFVAKKIPTNLYMSMYT